MEEEHKGPVAAQETSSEKTYPSKNQLARDVKKMKKKVA
jgi:hypothetical protein